MADARLDRLAGILLKLLPVDGKKVPNGQLRPQWVEAAAAAGEAVTEADFDPLRDSLVAAGLLVKGPGRGGATGRAASSAPTADDFELETGTAPVPDAAAKPATTRKVKAKGTAAPRAADEPAQVISYRHADRRKNNPEVGLVNEASDPYQPKQTWAYNPHLDPVLNFDSNRAELENQIADALASGDTAVMKAALEEIKRRGAPYLQWAGKAERTSFDVDTVSLHVHERIDPMSILSAVRKGGPSEKNAGPADAGKPRQASLFEAPFENLPLRDAVDFYRHDKGWANRLVCGDSLQVMNSLLVKEGMAGQVQMVYIDPPYGIKYGSNFQPFVGKRDVKDKSDADLTQEPEMIKAFRDTWELGLHSYLSYLRDRLLLSKELLRDSGSVFVQISDENLHLVRNICDEIFGPENFVSVITFIKTSGQTSELLSGVSDYLVWYAKDKALAKGKFHQVFAEKSALVEGGGEYVWLRQPKGGERTMTSAERADIEKASKAGAVFRHDSMVSQGFRQFTTVEVEFQGRRHFPGATNNWKTTVDGIWRLGRARRLVSSGSVLKYKRFVDDFPVVPIGNNWSDTATGGSSTDPRVYVVQTVARVVERCMLMTTDPGDLVFDPTCGSGTTAFVAEKWGRRWITCDTSRVAVTLAKQRLMTASFDYYELRYPNEGLKGGFINREVPHIKLGDIANNADIDTIYGRLHPTVEEALAALNVALAKHAPLDPLTVTEGVRKG